MIRLLRQAGKPVDPPSRRRKVERRRVRLERRGSNDYHIEAASAVRSRGLGEISPTNIKCFVGAEALCERQPLRPAVCDRYAPRSVHARQHHMQDADRPGADDKQRPEMKVRVRHLRGDEMLRHAARAAIV